MIDTEKRKLAASALIDVVTNHSARLRIHPTSLRSLLNDSIPHFNHERFVLCAPIELPKFTSVLRTGGFTARDFDTLLDELTKSLGFEHSTALWCTQTWQLALGVKGSAEVRTRFNCPNCFHPGEAELYWGNQRALCPHCNSHVLFAGDLTPSVHRQGWKRKRVPGGTWALVSTERPNSLKEQIRNIINNESLSPSQIADAIELNEICHSMRSQIADIMQHDDCSPTESNRYRLVSAIVLAILGTPITIPLDVLGQYAAQVNFQPNCCLAFSNGIEAHKPHGIMFGGQSLGYIEGETSWTIPYQSLESLAMQNGTTVFDLGIGQQRSISVKGLGITRSNLSRTLLAVSRAMAELEQSIWLSKR